MADELSTVMPYGMTKPYFEAERGHTREWEADKHKPAIARQYSQTLNFIKELMITNPESTIELKGQLLIIYWKSGQGTMYMDAVDMAVLIPRIEELTGRQLKHRALAA